MKYVSSVHYIRIVVTGGGIHGRIKLRQDNFYFIDDVSVTKDGMTLDESIDNATWITGNNNKTRTVKTVRTLKANIWNTLYLPFDVNKDLLEATPCITQMAYSLTRL